MIKNYKEKKSNQITWHQVNAVTSTDSFARSIIFMMLNWNWKTINEIEWDDVQWMK